MAYSRHVLRERAIPGDPRAVAEDLYGFTLVYERLLIPEWLLLEISKPFLWGEGRFDSPFGVTLALPLRLGRRWEANVGLGGTMNLRVFDKETEEEAGISNKLSLGLTASAGLAVEIRETWALHLNLEGAYIPGSDVVRAELTPTLGVVHHF